MGLCSEMHAAIELLEALDPSKRESMTDSTGRPTIPCAACVNVLPGMQKKNHTARLRKTDFEQKWLEHVLVF